MRFLAVAMAVMLWGATVPAMAESAAKASAGPSIMVIDVQRILQESLAAKSVQAQLESHRAKFQNDISREEKELRKAEQDLAGARETLKPDLFAEREQLLRQRFLTVERHVQAKRKALDQAFTDSMNTVRNNLLTVVEKAARERSANLVLVKQQALWVDKTLDVTDEVLTRLNKALPQVAVTVPPEEVEKDGVR